MDDKIAELEQLRALDLKNYQALQELHLKTMAMRDAEHARLLKRVEKLEREIAELKARVG